MFLVAVLLVSISGLIHSIWNLFAKQSVHKVVFLWCCQWTAILTFLPMTVRELLSTHHSVSVIGCLYVLASMILHGCYVLMLAKTYSFGDLSQAYPIMRGTSPLLAPVAGVLLLGEHLTLLGWMGVICIVIGICLIGGVHIGRMSYLSKSGVFLAFGVGLLITCYTVFDKVTLQYIPPITLNEASNVGNLIALSWAALRSRAIRQEWTINWKTILLGGVMAPGGYILFLKALQIMPVAQLAPMREIGTVFGALLGVTVLHEPQGTKRIGAAALIVLGIMLLANMG